MLMLHVHGMIWLHYIMWHFLTKLVHYLLSTDKIKYISVQYTCIALFPGLPCFLFYQFELKLINISYGKNWEHFPCKQQQVDTKWMWGEGGCTF